MEDDEDVATDVEDRAQGATTPRLSPRVSRKADTTAAAAATAAGSGGQPQTSKNSPKLAPKFSPKVAAKVPKPVTPNTSSSPSATDAASGQTSQLSPKTGQSSPKTGQKEDGSSTSKVISILSLESPKLHLLSVLGVLIPHMKYTQQETRMESLRWLMWLHQQLPKRVSRQPFDLCSFALFTMCVLCAVISQCGIINP